MRYELSKMKLPLFGVAIGSIVTSGVWYVLIATRPLPTRPVGLVPVKLPSSMATAVQGQEERYALPGETKDVGLLTLRSGALRTISLLDRKNRRSLQIELDKEGSIESVMTEILDDSLEAQQSMFDSDLDGVPDKRMDWKTNTFFVLDEIRWKPREKSAKKPLTTTQAASRPSSVPGKTKNVDDPGKNPKTGAARDVDAR